jgi:hypothetical protein
MSAAGAVLPRICLDPQTSPAAPNIPDADLLSGGFKINAGFSYRAAPNTAWDFGIDVGGDYNPGPQAGGPKYNLGGGVTSANFGTFENNNNDVDFKLTYTVGDGYLMEVAPTPTEDSGDSVTGPIGGARKDASAPTVIFQRSDDFKNHVRAIDYYNAMMIVLRTSTNDDASSSSASIYRLAFSFLGGGQHPCGTLRDMSMVSSSTRANASGEVRASPTAPMVGTDHELTPGRKGPVDTQAPSAIGCGTIRDVNSTDLRCNDPTVGSFDRQWLIADDDLTTTSWQLTGRMNVAHQGTSELAYNAAQVAIYTIPLVKQAFTTCSNAECPTPPCDSVLGDCDGDASNGCETNLASTTTHCGSCGNDCASLLQNAGDIECSGGTCIYGSCQSGFDDCDGKIVNGCETDVTTTTNCGSCGNDCTSLLQNAGDIECSGGTCVFESCITSHFDSCDGDLTNGCEANLKSDNDNCGTCGVSCDVDEFCNNGICATI